MKSAFLITFLLFTNFALADQIKSLENKVKNISQKIVQKNNSLRKKIDRIELLKDRHENKIQKLKSSLLVQLNKRNQFQRKLDECKNSRCKTRMRKTIQRLSKRVQAINNKMNNNLNRFNKNNLKLQSSIDKISDQVVLLKSRINVLNSQLEEKKSDIVASNTNAESNTETEQTETTNIYSETESNDYSNTNTENDSIDECSDGQCNDGLPKCYEEMQQSGGSNSFTEHPFNCPEGMTLVSGVDNLLIIEELHLNENTCGYDSSFYVTGGFSGDSNGNSLIETQKKLTDLYCEEISVPMEWEEECEDTEKEITAAVPLFLNDEDPTKAMYESSEGQADNTKVAVMDTTFNTDSSNTGTFTFYGEEYNIFELPYNDRQYDGCNKCIAPGVYRVIIQKKHAKFGVYTPRLLSEDTYPRAGILQHKGGNYLVNSDGSLNNRSIDSWSDGCILFKPEDMIKYKNLLQKHDVVEFTLVIKRSNKN